MGGTDVQALHFADPLVVERLYRHDPHGFVVLFGEKEGAVRRGVGARQIVHLPFEVLEVEGEVQ
jgi:hypothetical protein